jgi:hypothetical protein
VCVRIDVRMIAPRKALIRCIELGSPESRHIDAQPPEENDRLLYTHSEVLQSAFLSLATDIAGGLKPGTSINR